MNDKPEHEASDPIKTPFLQELKYSSDSRRLTCGRDIIGTFSPEVGQHIALCINERPQLLAETLRLRQAEDIVRHLAEIASTIEGSDIPLRIVVGRAVEYMRGQEVEA